MIRGAKAQDEIKETVKEVQKVARKPLKKKELKGNLHTGSDLMNLVFGGGHPYGFVNSVGDSSSGKSFLAGEFIACCFHALKDELEWFYDDAERGYKFNTQKLYDMDILNDGLLPQKRRSTTIEDFTANIKEIIAKKDPKKPFIYVIDSWDSISSDAELAFMEKKAESRKSKREPDSTKDKKEKGTYGLNKQKDTHALFRTMIRDMEENKIVLYVISQVKENISFGFGAKYYRTGGKALDFYPNVIFWLAEVEKYMKKGRVIGICTKVRCTKGRNDKPFRECFVDLIFDYGIDNVASNINFLYDLKTSDRGQDKKKLDCDWDGEVYSRAKLVTFIENKNLESELTLRTQQKWHDIEKEISSDGRKRRW